MAEFQREVAAMQSLKSKHVLRILGACFEKGRYCIVTDLAKNGSLYSLLQSARPLSDELRCQLALECARGLQYLHSPGYVHRDIKSLNVLVTDDWHAKLAEYALVCVPCSGSWFGCSFGRSAVRDLHASGSRFVSTTCCAFNFVPSRSCRTAIPQTL